MFLSFSFPQGFLVLIFMTSQILMLMAYLHIFCYFQDTFHWSSALPKKFKKNINKALHQAIRTGSDNEVGKDRIFKKHLNAG